jgi:hypothetical protein
VEAAGVEPDTGVENAQVIDSENARIGVSSKIAKSTVRSLYSHFPEFQELPNSTFRRSPLRERSILKCDGSISQHGTGGHTVPAIGRWEDRGRAKEMKDESNCCSPIRRP